LVGADVRLEPYEQYKKYDVESLQIGHDLERRKLDAYLVLVAGDEPVLERPAERADLRRPVCALGDVESDTS
jgi:hypothetical protein